MNKVVFQLPTKKIELPSYPGSELLLNKVTVEQARKVRQGMKVDGKNVEEDSEEMVDITIQLIVSCITSSNFTDSEGNDLPITAEMINQMPQEDVDLLIFECLGHKTQSFEKNE